MRICAPGRSILQVYFLGHRARQHMDLWNDERSAIVDRSIYEDAYIFARALNKMGNLTDLDYQSYLSVFDLVIRRPSCPFPAGLPEMPGRCIDGTYPQPRPGYGKHHFSGLS